MSVLSVVSERVTGSRAIRRAGADFVTAVQFLTRIPLPSMRYESDSLSRAVKFFPIVGLLVGSSAALLNAALSRHLPRAIVAVVVVAFLVILTGCLHEDGLADVADAFGGGWNRDQILSILKDSRIGSFGGAALVLSLALRVFLLASLSSAEIARYLIAAHVLSRWTTLPLSCFLASANDAGQGARIARMTSRGTLVFGSLVTVILCGFALRERAVVAVAGAALLVLGSGFYYRSKIGGVTGDCFGATNQLTEIFVYMVGVWAL